MKLEYSQIMILGASGGIGSEVARQLARRGARLILVGRQRDPLMRLAQEIHDEGHNSANVLIGDLATDAAAMARQAIRVSGEVDILINCAGMQTFGFSNDESAQETSRMLSTNVIGPIQLTNALLPHMLARGHGRIVHVGSIFGSIGFPCFASYSASKFALRGFSEALRRELIGTGIRVHYIAPRYTRTPFNRDVVAQMANALNLAQDDPADVARQVIAAITRERADTYLGWPERLFVRLNSIFPRLVDLSLMKQVSLMRPFARTAAARQQS
jgi:short-subunit dehydrogenase